jgi:hypothetical protein
LKGYKIIRGTVVQGIKVRGMVVRDKVSVPRKYGKMIWIFTVVISLNVHLVQRTLQHRATLQIRASHFRFNQGMSVIPADLVVQFQVNIIPELKNFADNITIVQTRSG